MRYKVTFDARRPFALGFGRVVYIEAEPEAVEMIALIAAQEAEPDAQIEQLGWRPATEAEYQRYQAHLQRRQQWRENVYVGITNRRQDL